MSKKYLPIKMVLQRNKDIEKNTGGGGELKIFRDVTQDLKDEISEKFNNILDFYKDLFLEDEFIPAVSKITVIPEAIAKSHKPNDLCQKFSIIGGGGLNETYVKVTKESIEDTIRLIQDPPSKKFMANLSAIEDIQPIKNHEKIATSLLDFSNDEKFNLIKDKIKLKIFDFNNEIDNNHIMDYVENKFLEYGFKERYSIKNYGGKIKLIKIEVSSYDDIITLSKINGIETIDFFQEYSQPSNELLSSEFEKILEEDGPSSETIIGIIDGGISDENIYLKPYIEERIEYVPKDYQNHKHGTFIASTIQYGNKLNGIDIEKEKKFKFLDVVAIPNNDEKYGNVDTINESDLVVILEEVMEKYSKKVKIWNLSLGLNKICSDKMSDLGLFLDYIQDKYDVQIFVSSGNILSPLREWPVKNELGDKDRITSPAESVRAITVGSLALYDSDDSIVKKNAPSPFSRRGPGVSYITKPELVDYGGNIRRNKSFSGIGIKGLDIKGNIIEGIGTSYSNPRIVQKFASVYDEMVEKDILIAKALIIHSARMQSKEFLEIDRENMKYFGFGMPVLNTQEVLQCSDDEVTLIFHQKVPKGSHLEMFDFPYPQSLIRNDKYFGEICMTLVYNPPLDQKYSGEYCRTNIDVGFGVYKKNENGKFDYKSEVPLEHSWEDKYEQSRVKNGYKWSPIKSYYRKIKNGIAKGYGWKIRVDLTQRNNTNVEEQDFVLIITIKDPDGNDIYSEVINELKNKGYITENLEIKSQVRQKN